MTTSFYDGFISKINDKKVGCVVLEYFTKHSHFDGFVFVEGPSDILFYSRIANIKLNDGKVNYISCCGKTNLIKSLNYFGHNNLLGKNNHYIVDKDYTGIMMYKPDFPDKITMTKYYSFENYVFEEGNFFKFLKECSCNEDEIKIINNLLKKYIEEIIDFETIISMNANNEICVKLSSKEIDENIHFINEDKIIIEEKFINRINDIILSLSKRKKKLFKKRKEELLSNYLNIRGHDLEFFIDNVLILFDKDQKLIEFLSKEEFLSKLEIDIDLK